MTDSFYILLADPDEDFAAHAIVYMKKMFTGALKVVHVTHIQSFWTECSQEPPDMVLLSFDAAWDISPEFVSRLRTLNRKVAVACLSSSQLHAHMDLAFQAGVDEFVWKQTLTGEGWVRLLRWIRQMHGQPAGDRISCIGVCSSFDAELQLLRVNGKDYRLPRAEARILETLCDHRNHVVPHETLLRCCDDRWALNTHSKDRSISHLRKFLAGDPTVLLEAIRPTGYVLKVVQV